ncbi:hypothetical protein [Kitasatospora purpeofusca]|uniref:hypothetical protein n=1 Tax=Kitasatospora purpeofusca TaxID=67352 RepID=UPI0036D4029B
MTADTAGTESWYAVRCVFQWDTPGAPLYEERLTLWQAGSADEAIERAEDEAGTYADDNGLRYLELAQCYTLATDGRPGDGDEVFSLLRESQLGREDYLDHYFDSGTERQGAVAEE